MLITHSACNVVWRRSGGVIEFLVMDYQSINPNTDRLTNKEVRFPAGTSRSGEFGESTEETSVRKLEEETGLLAIDVDRIAEEAREDHIKYVFLISFANCTGELRQGSPITIGGDVMSAPYWVQARRLRKLIAPPHFWAYRAACEELRRS